MPLRRSVPLDYLGSMLRCLAAFVLPVVLVGCSCLPAAPAELECTLVVLATGPRTVPLTAEERTKVFGGHFANMERLAREGQLLVAGPYGKEKSDPARRGLFVLATKDAARAKELAETDPGFLAGVFRLEYHSLTTTAPLRAQLAKDLAAADAIKASGRTPAPGEGGRGYVLLTASDGAAASAALAKHPAVLIAARIGGNHAMFWLDAKDAAAARAAIADCSAALGTFTLDEWFGSGLLAELRGGV